MTTTSMMVWYYNIGLCSTWGRLSDIEWRGRQALFRHHHAILASFPGTPPTVGLTGTSTMDYRSSLHQSIVRGI